MVLPWKPTKLFYPDRKVKEFAVFNSAKNPIFTNVVIYLPKEIEIFTKCEKVKMIDDKNRLATLFKYIWIYIFIHFSTLIPVVCTIVHFYFILQHKTFVGLSQKHKNGSLRYRSIFAILTSLLTNILVQCGKNILAIIYWIHEAP